LPWEEVPRGQDRSGSQGWRWAAQRHLSN
jgi:hypothetical protein